MEKLKSLKGIWLDSKQAVIVSFQNDEAKTEVVLSNIDDFHAIGGTRSKTPWGPMDTNPEKKYEERKKHQLRKYFDEVLKKVEGAKALYLFGPASTKNQLSESIADRHQFRGCKVTVESADSMTEPQKIARVKEHFDLDSLLNKHPK